MTVSDNDVCSFEGTANVDGFGKQIPLMFVRRSADPWIHDNADFSCIKSETGMTNVFELHKEGGFSFV